MMAPFCTWPTRRHEAGIEKLVGRERERLVQPVEGGEQDGARAVTVHGGKFGGRWRNDSYSVAPAAASCAASRESPQREITVRHGACPAT